MGNLLYALSTRSKHQIHHLHRYLIKYICEEKIKNEPQLLGRKSDWSVFSSQFELLLFQLPLIIFWRILWSHSIRKHSRKMRASELRWHPKKSNEWSKRSSRRIRLHYLNNDTIFPLGHSWRKFERSWNGLTVKQWNLKWMFKWVVYFDFVMYTREDSLLPLVTRSARSEWSIRKNCHAETNGKLALFAGESASTMVMRDFRPRLRRPKNRSHLLLSTTTVSG